LNERVVRAAIGAQAVSFAVVGVWAAFAPRGFYDDFPGGGRAWVAADGPYNEYLVRDVGVLNLALLVVSVVAVVTVGREVVLAAALGALAYDVPHLVYHLRHLDVYDTGDKVANAVALSAAVALPVIALAAWWRGRPAATRPSA
jgi:hypothetical protein